MTRRLRVLSGHPHLGRPNDVVREFEGAQAYVDAGFCEWVDDVPVEPGVVDRSAPVETTDVRGAAEATVTRAGRSTAVPARPVTGARRGAVRPQ